MDLRGPPSAGAGALSTGAQPQGLILQVLFQLRTPEKQLRHVAAGDGHGPQLPGELGIRSYWPLERWRSGPAPAEEGLRLLDF